MASSASEALQALVACAKAIQDWNLKLADSLLERIWNLAADQSDPRTSNVVKYFAEALVRRAYGISSPSAHFTLLAPPPMNSVDNFSWSVIETSACMGKKQFHVITFFFQTPYVWVHLFRSLSNASRDSPSVRITVIVSPFLEKKAKIQQEKRKHDLTTVATQCEIKLEDLRVVYANSLGDVDASQLDFRRTKDEAVIVYYEHKLHQLLADARVMERELSKLREINPEIVFIKEQDADHNDPNFIKRLEVSFQYYLHLNTLDIFCRRPIGNMVGCEGSDRLVRHQTLAQWQSLLLANGLLQVPLGPYALFLGNQENGCLKYRGRPMYFNPISYNRIQGFNPNPPLEDTVQPLQVDPQASSLNRLAAFAEIYDMLEDVCLTYELPLALTWVKRNPNEIMSGPNKKHSPSIETTCSYVNYHYCYHCYGYDDNYHTYFLNFFNKIIRHENFMKECAKHNLLEGQAIAGQALQSNEPFLFERNISQLENYPFALAAKELNFQAALAICLENHYTADVYILEFFLPPSVEELEEQESLARRIFEDLKIMKKKFVKLRVVESSPPAM